MEIVAGVSAIVIGLSLPVIADAAPDGTSAREAAMAALDTDHDNKISPAEWQAATDKRFKESDTNGDGYVSQEEALAEQERRTAEMRKRRAEAMFKRADTNNDGKLSKAEFDASSKAIYAAMAKRRAESASSSGKE
jgi:hypothetical protein